MWRAQERARSARSRKNGARNATIKSRALGALKLVSEASCARWECAREAGRFFSKLLLVLRGHHGYYWRLCYKTLIRVMTRHYWGEIKRPQKTPLDSFFWRLSRQSYYSVASSRRDKWRNLSCMAASALWFLFYVIKSLTWIWEIQKLYFLHFLAGLNSYITDLI